MTFPSPSPKRAQFSSNAMMSLGIAAAVPLSVCTNGRGGRRQLCCTWLVANVEPTRLVVGAIGKRTNLKTDQTLHKLRRDTSHFTPATTPRHPRFYIILPVRRGTQLFGGHVENPVNVYQTTSDEMVREEQVTGMECLNFQQRPSEPEAFLPYNSRCLLPELMQTTRL